MADRQEIHESIAKILDDLGLLVASPYFAEHYSRAGSDNEIVSDLIDSLERAGFVFVGPDHGTSVQYGCEHDDNTHGGRRAFVVDGQIAALGAARQYSPSGGAAVQRHIITGPWRPMEDSDELPGDDYYRAERDTQGNIRLNGGRGLLVANADHTVADVQGWFERSKPGQYHEQYRAALALFEREEQERVDANTKGEKING